MSDPAEVFKSALSLGEGGAERLWGQEAQRRLAEYRAGRAKAVRAEEVAQKAERLFR